MSFAAPLALLWALAMAPVIALYVLKVRQRRMVVPTVMFWQQVFDDKRPRTLWQRLRHLLSLLMQLLVIALLVLALAQPLLGWQLLEPRHVVLIIDTSASMSATDVAPTRLAEAKRRAAGLIDGLRYFDNLAIIAAASQPRVACGMTSHQRTLTEAVDAIEATDSPTSLEPAVQLARRLLAGHAQSEIIVLTDAAFDTSVEFAAAPDVTLIRIGGKAANVGITQFQVRRSFVDPLGYQLLIEVSNFSDDSRETRLEIDLDDQPVDVFPLTLAPGAPGRHWTQAIEKTSAAGGRLVAKLVHTDAPDTPDALAADNIAYAVLPARRPQDVILVTKGNLFLQKVFEAIALVRLQVMPEPPPPEGIPPGAIVVYHRQVPAQIPPGRVLVIEPEISTDLWQAGDPLENPLIAQQDTASPLMAHVRLDNLFMPEARRLKPAEDAAVFAAALTGEPIYFGFDRPQGRTLVLTANLDRGDLPLRTAFPIMMTNALNWFSGGGGELQESASTGQTTTVTLAPHGPASATVTSPTGHTVTVPVQGQAVTLGPLTHAGIWTVQRGDELALVPVNLCSRRESDLVPPPPDALNEQTAALAGAWGGKPSWFYLLAVACGLAALEWFLYQRRWIS